jgi:hypothetical protein
VNGINKSFCLYYIKNCIHPHIITTGQLNDGAATPRPLRFLVFPETEHWSITADSMFTTRSETKRFYSYSERYTVGVGTKRRLELSSNIKASSSFILANYKGLMFDLPPPLFSVSYLIFTSWNLPTNYKNLAIPWILFGGTGFPPCTETSFCNNVIESFLVLPDPLLQREKRNGFSPFAQRQTWKGKGETSEPPAPPVKQNG